MYIILGINETAIMIPISVNPTGSNTPKFEVILEIKPENIALVNVNVDTVVSISSFLSPF